MFDDNTWRYLGELLKDFIINANGDVVMRTKRGDEFVGNVQDGKTPSNLLHFAIRSI